LIVNVNQCFIPHSYLATVTFLNFDVDWAKIFFYAIEAHIWSYHTFSKYLSVWDKALLSNHKTKRQSR